MVHIKVGTVVGMDVAALVISVLALISAGFATWYARSEAHAADVSATAAIAAERRAEIIEQRNRFGWRVDQMDVGLYILRNTGWERALNVRIESVVTVDFPSAREVIDLEPGQGVALVAMLPQDIPVSDMDLQVTWSVEDEGEDREWSEPFPTRPPTPREFDATIRNRIRG